MSDYLTDFVQESEERITELNNALLTLERDPDDEEAMEQIFRIAHTLKGNCGAMGLESASDLAHAIEDLLDAVRGGDIEVTPELMDVVFEAVDELETMIDEVAADGEIDTDPSATIDAVREYLERDTARPGLASPTPEEIDEICSRFAPPTDDDRDVYLARLDIAEREGVNNGKLVVDALIDAFELMGTAPSRDRIEADEYDRGFDAVFATAVGEAAIASGLEPVEEVDDFEIVDVDDRFEAAPADDPGDVAAEDISSADAQDLEVDELLDEFDEFDNLDEMVEDVEDEELDAFEDMGEAGSFDDLLDEEDVEELEAEPGQPPAEHRETDAASGGADADTAAGGSAADDGDDEVDDASAVFDELKDEVEMVGFDELQDELEELEFDEFDEDEEVDMDELLGEEADDDAFLEGEEPTESAVDDMLVDAETDPAADELAAGESEVDGSADAEETADTDVVAAPASDDRESGAEGDEPATDAPETEPADGIEADTTPEPADEPEATPDTAGSPASDEATAESTDTEAETALEESTEPDGTAAPAADDADDTEPGAAETGRPADDPIVVDDAPADEAGVSDADTEPAIDDATDERVAVDADDGAPTDLETETDDGTDLEEADTATAGADTVDDVEADDGAETPAADSSVADADIEAGAADDSFGTDDGFEPSAGFDDGLETADEDPFGDEPIDDAADSFSADDEFEVSADSVDLEDGDDGFGGFDDDIDDGLDDDAFDDTDAFDVDTDFGSSTDESESGSESSFGDDADDDEGDDVVRTVEEPEFEIPDIEIPDTDVEQDADDEADEIQSVRVDVEQVDSLLNLVEGLVTSRVRLRHAAEADDDNDALETELDALSDLTTDLQETVMDIRLVPLRTVTNRLPRVVRDIAREQDKEVAFEMTGEDVELDRSILDRIGDPLIHLVRNAVDHGVEPPAEREAADKPTEGSVEVHADRESDRVTITVEDDGSGLDPNRLRDEAVEAGVLEPEVAAELPDEDAYDLIFHPGLSTADEVTDVSGRGVGMDVVKRTVEDLEGMVSIDSEAGEGTTVTMELPVTVAIDEILFVESGGEEFGVPTKAVRDIEPATAIETTDGESILPGEDGDYPVVSLADILETPAAGANGNGMVVRIRDDVREVALHCDRVSGQQEVVVKPFEGFMSGIPGISGATVRGRGEVVNILDVTTL
ncbi:Hpt domain-containing protein [Natrinema thermotolerans]|uniref:Chemotaxis protein CheA n=1 Tax=Natrinema thermotolerans TaxID=121872 RepID=A0AAF0PB08_9EURY|nr:Hpt domain-containing protein [Natrinema thermotolerans]QCC57716.1 chemotaxis protein CheA [Natrinema thermotolerans]WMT08798.1 Hpt domain-containing protein [Natrinema thermotolerans]